LGTSRRAARSRPRSPRRSRFTSTLRASHRRWTSRRRLASTSRPISRAGEMREMREMVWEMVKEMAPPATAARAASCRATSTLRGKHFPPFPGAMAIGFGDAGVAAGRRALRRHRRARRHAARIGGVLHRAAAPRLDGHGRARRLPADGAQRDLLRRATRRRCVGSRRQPQPGYLRVRAVRSVGSFTHQHLGRVSYLALGGARRLGPGDRCLPSDLCSCFDDKHRPRLASGARRLVRSWRPFDAAVVAAAIVSTGRGPIDGTPRPRLKIVPPASPRRRVARGLADAALASCLGVISTEFKISLLARGRPPLLNV